MKNSAFLYDYKDTEINNESIQVKDYFSYIYDNIDDLVRENFSLFEYLQLDNNDRLEIICYNRYGSEKYSDLIVMLNEANFMWMIPYDNNIQISIANAYSSYLTLEINNAHDDDKDLFIQQYGTEKSENENSQKRQIIVPKKESIENVITLLQSYKKAY